MYYTASMSLNTRQAQILKAIIEEYIELAQPIASVDLVQRRGIPLSGATVRNVMSHLVRKGYLKMQHISSGRFPTELAYRYYIANLMEEPDLSVLEEVSIKQKLLQEKYEVEKFLRDITNILSESTNCLSIALTENNFLSYTGSSKILEDLEFLEINVMKAVLRLVDDYKLAKSVFDKVPHNEGVAILIGREIGLAHMEPVSIIFTCKNVGGLQCYFGVIGPSRIRYNKVIPIIRYVSQLFDEFNE